MTLTGTIGTDINTNTNTQKTQTTHILQLQVAPRDVDFRIMLTFLEFYETLLRFALFKLYHSLEIAYPPCVFAFVHACYWGGTHNNQIMHIPKPQTTGNWTAAWTSAAPSWRRCGASPCTGGPRRWARRRYVCLFVCLIFDWFVFVLWLAHPPIVRLTHNLPIPTHTSRRTRRRARGGAAASRIRPRSPAR